jgi:4-amino-4-deoxy-L-arabinose transferase-like glycosyltransferase
MIEHAGSRWERFAARHFAILAIAVLVLALFNLSFRLGREFVAEWDESLYAISAWEVLKHHSWLGTTLFDQLDYYNSKPPLLVWTIAASFKLFGPGLVSLRLGSIVSAWATVAVLLSWTRRCFGPFTAILSAFVLATTFGFLYVHSGRSAATDAPYTLILLLTAVTLWAEVDRPARRVWLGPLLAAAFLFRGMAVLMPLLLVVGVVATRRPRVRIGWRWNLLAAACFVIPVGAWVLARYQLDGWAFLRPLFMYDFVERTVRPIEEHPGGLFFYLYELQKTEYEWLFVLLLAWALFPPARRVQKRAVALTPDDTHDIGSSRRTAHVLIVYAVISLVVPSVMQTKVPWYLNTFFPVFAVAVALSIRRGLRVAAASRSGARNAVLAAIVVLAGVVAETRLIWYSFHYRDLGLSNQSLILAERDRLRGRRLFFVPLSRAGHFVAAALAGAEPQRQTDMSDVRRVSRSGDFIVGALSCATFDADAVRSTGREVLCLKR